MLVRHRPDECVIHETAGDAVQRKSFEKLSCVPCAEVARLREVGLKQSRCRLGCAAYGWRRPRQDRIGLERGVAGQRKTVTRRADRVAVLFIIGYDERGRRARVD